MAYSAPGYKQSGPIGLKMILILISYAQIREY